MCVCVCELYKGRKEYHQPVLLVCMFKNTKKKRKIELNDVSSCCGIRFQHYNFRGGRRRHHLSFHEFQRNNSNDTGYYSIIYSMFLFLGFFCLFLGSSSKEKPACYELHSDWTEKIEIKIKEKRR